MHSAETWAADIAIQRVADAVDHATQTYAAQQMLAQCGREALWDLVPTTLEWRDYPAGTDDDWRELADAAYSAAVRAWRSCGDESAIHRAASAAAIVIARAA